MAKDYEDDLVFAQSDDPSIAMMNPTDTKFIAPLDYYGSCANVVVTNCMGCRSAKTMKQYCYLIAMANKESGPKTFLNFLETKATVFNFQPTQIQT